MTGEAHTAGQTQGYGAAAGGKGPPWRGWNWVGVLPLVMVAVMVGLMAVGALTGGHWHCY